MQIDTFRMVARATLLGFAGVVLTACSQAVDPAPATSSPAVDATLMAATVDMALQLPAAQPTFHVAPVALDEPDDIDSVVSNVSAQMEPHLASVPGSLAHLSTRQLTRGMIDAALQDMSSAKTLMAAGPLAAGSVVATYSPAQIRAAYGLPALGTATAAQLGAGQTVYLIEANNNPNVAAELTAFDQKFGLNGCTLTPIPVNAALPLPAPSPTGCALSVVYSTAAGAMTASVPAYNSGWSTEISLDVQWVHASAPLARIVLIEAPDASINSLVAAVTLANAMGPGIVSMSFGAPEGGYTANFDSAFGTANMTYVASSGDSGASVNWPAVSTHVLAVGGTSLTYGGSAPRTETAWSGSGGGTSVYTAAPSYQTSTVPGMGAATHRNVPDVAFNADPATGQYVAVMAPGATTAVWVSAGGTSLAAPQWAGLIAVANAVRAQGAKPAIGTPHAVLYGQVASSPANYPSAFDDITKGANGACPACSAKPGYDEVTGLGTPNDTSLLPLVAGASSAPPSPPVPVAPTAPEVGSAAVSGIAGIALSYPISVVDSNPVTLSMTGAPAGLTLGNTGILSWSNPTAGTYTLIVTAKDAKTGLAGQGTVKLSIAARGPLITAPAINGIAGKPLTGTIGIADPGATSLAVKIAGVPPGMSFSSNGLTITASWAAPVTGSYKLSISVADSAGLSATATLPVTVAAH